MVQLLVLIDRFGCKLHAQLLKDLDIHVRQHDRGVYLAAPQFGELGQGLFGRTVRGRAHGQGNQYLVRVDVYKRQLQWWYIYVNLSKYHSWTPWFNIQKTGRPKKEF